MFATHGSGAIWVPLGPGEPPWPVFMGELTEMGFSFRLVVLAQASFKIVSVADVKTASGVLEDVNLEHPGGKDGIKWLPG